MTFSAYVQFYSGEAVRTVENGTSGEAVAIAQSLTPAWVEIVESEIGASLFRYCSEGNYVADTWHESVEEARCRAKEEFGINERDWFKG